MPIRKILAPLSGRFDPADPESLDWCALETGLKIGQELQAHLEVLCVTGPLHQSEKTVAAWLPGYGLKQLSDLLEKEGEARSKRARSSFEAAISNLSQRPHIAPQACPGFSVDFVELVGEIRETVGLRGRLTDLIVIANSPERWRWHYRPILEASLRDTGRPLLVSPPKAPPSVGRRIAIAWNGSMEASRAVTTAVGFLQPGAEVLIISAAENNEAAPAVKDVVDYLRWHEIESTPLELKGGRRSGGDAVIDRVLASNCDLLVMGACIHSRAHRAIYGSMTETVLSGAQITALMVP